MSNILRDYFKDDFRIGAALNRFIYDDEARNNFKPKHEFPGMEEFAKKLKNMPDVNITKEQFNIIVAENDTKMCNVYPAENTFNFEQADKIVAFSKANNMALRWHTLVWHNQSPEWIFKNSDGSKASKELLEERLKKYIFTVGNRYKDDICSVDVVNECISDKDFNLRDGCDRSQWFDILGPDYIDKAFHWAKEAFPKSSLVINDYNLEMIPGKREGMYKLLKGMLERGVPVDTVGLQMHINLESPSIEELEKTFDLYASLGLKVIVTEMDVSIYKWDEPKKDITPEILDVLAERYYRLFECFKRKSKEGILKDVVLWGVTDAFTWKNNFPVPNRPDAPLLFDNEGKPKAAFDKLFTL